MKIKQLANITITNVVLINVLAILGLRWFTFAGKFGAGSVVIWIAAALLFFIPSSLICAEFGAAHPDKEGAITDWVKAELGERCALFTSLFYFIAQIFFIPTMLTFVGIGVGYAINPQLANNKTFISGFVIIAFWATMFLTTKNLKSFKKITGAVCVGGTILPIFLLIVAAIISVVFLKHKVPTNFSCSNWIPNIKLNNILFLIGITSGLAGAEISAPFISKMKNPQKSFPLAIIIATVLIVVCYIIGTLSLIMVVPPEGFSTSAGIFSMLKLVFSEVHMSFLADLTFILIAISMLVGVILWLASPAKILIDGNDSNFFPKFMLKKNSDGFPINTIILQGIIVTLIMFLNDSFLTVDAMYNIFVMAASVLLFLSYSFVFLAFLKMKLTQKTKKTFEVPGKIIGAIVVFMLVIATCLISIIIPIASVPHGTNIFIYEAEIIGIPLIFTVLGILLCWKKHKKNMQGVFQARTNSKNK